MMERFIVGLMSGTSVDGIDAALTRIIGSGLTTKVEVLAFETYAFPSQIKRKILKALHPDTSDVRLICSLNFELGYCFADAVKTLCQKAKFDLERLDAIGSHGQTIYHLPKAEADVVPSTLQIGEPAVIAFETKTQVVSNFRVMDMAAGGQGAPLVPYVDYLLFRKAHQAIALQNIGGIGNVTVIPQQAALEDVYAFDTGPGNMIIDALVHHFYGDAFDPNGKYARAGSVNERLLEKLMSDPFIREKPPKTTGRERFGKDFVDVWLANWSHIPANDFITTVTMFTAQAIAYNYKTFILPNDPIDEMIVSGGGSHNQTLMDWLRKLLPDIKIKTAEDCGLSSDAKEAVAFAVLANEMLDRHPANIPRATGASCPVVLGNLTPYMK